MGSTAAHYKLENEILLLKEMNELLKARLENS